MCLQRLELNNLYIITARKRSLGQGNVFTPVSHSVHGARVYTTQAKHPPDRHPTGQTPPPPRQTPPRQTYTPLGEP